jgi:hypothetical protein
MTREIAILLGFGSTDVHTRTHLIDTATRLSHACGCETSGAFGAVALVATGIWLLQPGNASLSGVGLAIAAVLSAGIVGKALGLGIARARLRVVQRALKRWPIA